MVSVGVVTSSIYSNVLAIRLKQTASPFLPIFLCTPQRKPKPYAFLAKSSRHRTISMATSPPSFAKPRTVAKKVAGNAQYEGPISVSRTIGGAELEYLDPFIIFDFFEAKPGQGFDDHPHRGFEVVTHVLQGVSTHRDFAGFKGTIRADEVQWMISGRGNIHSEWPSGTKDVIGFQLWINLASKNKSMEPRYQDLKSKDIPRVQKDGVDVRIIMGESFDVRSPVFTVNPTMYLDFTLEPGAQVHQRIPESWNSCLFVVQGEGVFGSPSASAVGSNHLVVLSDGDGLSAWNNAAGSLRFVLIAGVPLNEPMVKNEFFVMNTEEELREAMEDYQNCRNGFEKGRNYNPGPHELE